jgi:hypothetical protein
LAGDGSPAVMDDQGAFSLGKAGLCPCTPDMGETEERKEMRTKTELRRGETLGDAVWLMKRMAREILECYDALDEVAEMLGQPAYPRNSQLVIDVDKFAERFSATTD